MSVPLQRPHHSAVAPNATGRPEPGAGRAARGGPDAAQREARPGQARHRELGQPRGHPAAGPAAAHQAGGLHGVPLGAGHRHRHHRWPGRDPALRRQDAGVLAKGDDSGGGVAGRPWTGTEAWSGRRPPDAVFCESWYHWHLPLKLRLARCVLSKGLLHC